MLSAAKRLYVITAKPCMASRACACMIFRRLDAIQHFVLIPYSPFGTDDIRGFAAISLIIIFRAPDRFFFFTAKPLCLFRALYEN